jgi:ATP-dependent RNA helicase DDX31/DBP7
LSAPASAAAKRSSGDVAGKAKRAKVAAVLTVPKAKEERPVQLYAREVIEPVAAGAAAVAPLVRAAASDDQVFASSAFASLGLSGAMCRNIEQHMKLERPTVVQQRAVAHVLGKRDVVLKGRTGLGKTLAFLLPIIDMLQQQEGVSRESGTFAVIVAPTKELAGQLYEEAVRVVRHAFNWIVPGVLSGGRKKDSEKKSLRKGVTIVISTPGRLLDHLRTTKAFRVARVQFLVLDEADRLLDSGFEKDLGIIAALLRERSASPDSLQTIMTSATWSTADSQTAVRVTRMHDPLFIDADLEETLVAQQAKLPEASVASKRKAEAEAEDEEEDDDNDDDASSSSEVVDAMAAAEVSAAAGAVADVPTTVADVPTTLSMPSQLQQHYLVVPMKERLVALTAFLRLVASSKDNCAIVFCSSITTVDFLHKLYSKLAAPTTLGEPQRLLECELLKLHGDMALAARQDVMASVQRAATQRDSKGIVLLSTDVAARGLDLPAVRWIIQYDPPTEPQEYVHRAGRTARLGRRGDALLFLTPEEVGYVDFLAKRGLQLHAMPLGNVMASLRFKSLPGVREQSGAFVLKQLIYKVVEASDALTEEANAAFAAHVRAYATHSRETKTIFNVRALHLGHVASSFGVKLSPADVARMNTSVLKHAKLAEQERAQHRFGHLTKEERRKQSFDEFAPF